MKFTLILHWKAGGAFHAHVALDKTLLWYNTERPHHSLKMISPMEFIINNTFLTPQKSRMMWTLQKIDKNNIYVIIKIREVEKLRRFNLCRKRNFKEE